jgi:transcriptional regulator with XRE-family HTH domain
MTDQIGIEIKKAREHKRLTQSEMADRLGINKRQYQRYEAGDSITIAALIQIGDILGTNFFSVFSGNDDTESRLNSYSEQLTRVLQLLQVSLDETAEIRAFVQKKDLRVVKEEVNKKLAHGLKVGK